MSLHFEKQPLASPTPDSLLSTMLTKASPPSSPQPQSDCPSILRRASLSSNGGKSPEPSSAPIQRHTSLKFAVAPFRQAERAQTPETPEESDSDDGYKEDEEDSDHENPPARFAKSTWRRRRQRTSPSPPPAPATVLPPPRRGRGHITVAEGTSEREGCSRHRSPSPVKSRSPSRTSDAGPRGSRAGSPMPEPMEESEDE